MKKTQNIDDILIAFRQNMTNLLFNEAKGSGLSLSHFEILIYIMHRGEVTMKDIATWLHITPPSASNLIETLVNKKLVTRAQSNKDRRTVHIILNKEAHKLIGSIHKKKMDVFKKMLSKLDKEDQSDLIRILNKCITN